MSRSAAQLNIRSDVARRRVGELVRETGKTATQVVEEAVLAYCPPPAEQVEEPLSAGFEWRNGRIVQVGGPHFSPEEHDRFLREAREDRDPEIRRARPDY